MYIDEPLRKYLDDLAKKLPTPGGGSAAALSASIGVSLMSMAANYTIGNPRYKDVEAKVKGVLARLEKFREDLKDLIDEDIEGYDRLYKTKRECKISSAEDAQDLYRGAIEPPFEVCKITGECLKLCKELARIGNENLITDSAIAAILLEGAFFSAKFNVYLNLKYIKDLRYVANIHKTLSPLEEEMPKLKEEILERCEEVILK